MYLGKDSVEEGLVLSDHFWSLKRALKIQIYSRMNPLQSSCLWYHPYLSLLSVGKPDFKARIKHYQWNKRVYETHLLNRRQWKNKIFKPDHSDWAKSTFRIYHFRFERSCWIHNLDYDFKHLTIGGTIILWSVLFAKW